MPLKNQGKGKGKVTIWGGHRPVTWQASFTTSAELEHVHQLHSRGSEWEEVMTATTEAVLQHNMQAAVEATLQEARQVVQGTPASPLPPVVDAHAKAELTQVHSSEGLQ